ncbi:VWA domain-containing protein [Flavobacteriales bacterium]|nr:VWA domain-containing protein [Flavobacteriales bacterium]
MKKTLVLLITSFFVFPSDVSSQQQDVNASLESNNLTTLKILGVFPEEFPKISIIFEAVRDSIPIHNLEKKQISVYEDDEECDIYSLEDVSKNTPIVYSIISDNSGSMCNGCVNLEQMRFDRNGVSFSHENCPIADSKLSIKNLIKNFNFTKDRMQVIRFGTRVCEVSEISNDSSYLNNILNNFDVEGKTALYDAIDTSLSTMEDQEGIKVIIALTDGYDNESKITSNDIILKALQLNIPIYTIGLGNVDKDVLSEIAQKTNGVFYYAEQSESLMEIYENVQKRINAIYNLIYSSKNIDIQDTSRVVRIEFDIDSLSLINNSLNFIVPSDHIEKYLSKKKDKRESFFLGYIIVGVLISSGVIIYRRYRRKE